MHHVKSPRMKRRIVSSPESCGEDRPLRRSPRKHVAKRLECESREEEEYPSMIRREVYDCAPSMIRLPEYESVPSTSRPTMARINDFGIAQTTKTKQLSRSIAQKSDGGNNFKEMSNKRKSILCVLITTVDWSYQIYTNICF